MSVLDLEGRKTVSTISVASKIQRIGISVDDRLVFTADQTKAQMAVIDTATNTLKTWIPMPAVGYGATPTPDGHWLVVPLRDGKQGGFLRKVKLPNGTELTYSLTPEEQ